MKSFLLLGLTGLAARVYAHPQVRHANPSPLSKRGVDINNFRLPELSEYKTSSEAVSSDSVSSITQSANYVDTAKDLVKSVAPDAEFRLVEDHYVGTNGIAHVNFKQTAHGIDIDNADFNVNVSFSESSNVASKLTSVTDWFRWQSLLVWQQLLQWPHPQGEPGRQARRLRPCGCSPGEHQRLGAAHQGRRCFCRAQGR